MGRVGGKTERHTGDDVGGERPGAPQKLQLPSSAIECPPPTETVVHEDLRRDVAGTQLVGSRPIAVVPAPVQDVDIPSSPLGGHADGETDE